MGAGVRFAVSMYSFILVFVFVGFVSDIIFFHLFLVFLFLLHFIHRPVGTLVVNGQILQIRMIRNVELEIKFSSTS